MTETADTVVQNRELKSEQALRAYLACGSWRKAGAQLGVHENTLRDRANRLPAETKEKIRKEARGQMVEDMTAILFQALGRMPEEIEKAQLRDLVGLFKVGVEKVLLMEGEATSRTEHSQLRDAVDDALKELQRGDTSDGRVLSR